MKKIINIYKGMGKEKKSGIWFTICSFIQKGISFITIPIFTRLMSTSEYGTVTLYNTWSSLLMIFATLNLSTSVYTRGLMEYEENEFTSIVQFISNFFTIVLFCILLLFHNFFVRMTGLDFFVLAIMCVYFVFEIGISLWSVKERFNYRYKKLVIVTILNAIFSSVFAIIAVINSNNKGIAKILSSTIALILFSLPFYLNNYFKGKKFFDKKIWKYVLCFSLPLVPHYLSNIILNQSDKIMINYFKGPTDVAYYGIAYSISSIILILINSLVTTMTPWRYMCLKKKNFIKLNTVSLKLLIVVAILVIFINLFAPEILKICANPDYYEAVWVIPPVILSIFFIFLYSFFSCVEFYYLKTKFMMIASVLSAILNIVLNYILINIYGYIACAYTTLICYIFYCIAHYIYMKHVCKKIIGSIEIYNIRKIIIISVICSILTLLSLFLYNNMMVRYIIILISLFIAFLNRKKIIEIFRLVKSNE